MQLDRIAVAGFRSFVDKVSIGDLKRINVFVGKNNAGKTNVIEILPLLNNLVGGPEYRRPEDFIARGQQKVSLVLMFSLKKNEREQMVRTLFKGGSVAEKDVISTNFLKGIKHSLEIVAQGIQQETVTTPNLIEGDTVVWGQFRNEKTGQVEAKGCDISQACLALRDIENLSVTLETRIGTGSPVASRSLWDAALKSVDLLPRMIRDMYAKIEWAPPIRQSQVQMPPTEVRRLDSSGSNLPQVWNTIVSDEPEELVRIGKDVGRIVGISSISAPVRGNQTAPSLKERSGDSFNLANTSSGVQQAAILATKISTCLPGGVLLIEEPELHLHAGAQRVLREIIERRSTDLQFFITTHSTLFTDLGEQSAVFLVSKKERQSTIRPIFELDELRFVKSELGHRNADLYGYDLVVFVEGDSEELALPIIAECLGVNLPRNGILLQNLRGASKAKKLGQYLEYLKDSGTMAFVVADGNKEVKNKLSEWEASGLLPKGNYMVWKQEFEDLFPLSLLAECLTELGYAGISPSELEAQKGTGSVVHGIRKLIHSTEQRDLDKPALAETIARRVCANRDLLPSELKEFIETLERYQKQISELPQ
jgi:putative ATP-dependent endonuclease of OLD family